MKTKYELENFSKVVQESISVAGVCRKLGLVPIGGNYSTIKWHIKKYNLDISHFTGQGWNKGLKVTCNPGITDEQFFQENTSHSGYAIKRRLFKYRQKSCEFCGLNNWLDQDLSLEVDHIDGDKFNNKLSNLRILCPNCHAQTDTYRGRSKRKYGSVAKLVSASDLNPDELRNTHVGSTPTRSTCIDCKKKISLNATRCKSCARLDTAGKIIWPDIEIILEKLKTISYVVLAKELGVSDNGIRNHLRKRNIIPPKGPMISVNLRRIDK